MQGRKMKKILLILLFLVSSAYGEIYTWKDSRGTVYYTNDQYEIPESYRAKSKVLDLGIEQKKSDNPFAQQNLTPQQNSPPLGNEQVKPVTPTTAPSPDSSQKRHHGNRAHRNKSGE